MDQISLVRIILVRIMIMLIIINHLVNDIISKDPVLLTPLSECFDQDLPMIIYGMSD